MRIAVLGGGPAGYSAAFEAARLGAEVTLVERDRLGGTCLNRGCIPTKTILRSAHIVADTQRAEEFGLVAAPARVDVDGLRVRKEGVVDELVGQIDSGARRLKVEVVSGEGRMASARAIEVTLADGSVRPVEADALILATGSVVFQLPGIDHTLEGVWTSDDAVSLAEIPDEILIIGGGVIGLEFACAYAAFGSKVTVVELMPQVLPGNDRRVVRATQESLELSGIFMPMPIDQSPTGFAMGDASDAAVHPDTQRNPRVQQGDSRKHSLPRAGQTARSNGQRYAGGRAWQRWRSGNGRRRGNRSVLRRAHRRGPRSGDRTRVIDRVETRPVARAGDALFAKQPSRAFGGSHS